MRRRCVYLDTSVINFLFAEDAPESRKVTEEFFEDYVRPGIYDVCVSPIVVDEIRRTPDERKRSDLLEVIGRYRLRMLNIGNEFEEIQSLARVYVENGIIPARKLEDALHIAVATVNGIDVLLSWNYRHLANLAKETRIQAANLEAGYAKTLRMLTPLEMMHEDEET